MCDVPIVIRGFPCFLVRKYIVKTTDTKSTNIEGTLIQVWSSTKEYFFGFLDIKILNFVARCNLCMNCIYDFNAMHFQSLSCLMMRKRHATTEKMLLRKTQTKRE